MKELYELCPKFDSCSAPKCPLDSQYHTRTQRFPEEERCTARKSVRLRIVMDNPGYITPYGGRTAHEFSGYRSYSHRAGSTELEKEVS